MINDCLRNIRYEIGYSKREFADLLGVSYNTYNAYEAKKKRPSFPTVRRIVDTLKEKGFNLKYSDLRKD